MNAFSYEFNNGSFSLSFNRCARTPLSWKEELYASAKNVALRAEKPIWIGYSGGMSSEIIAQAFFDQGIHFSVFTLAHKGGTNEHEIAHARAWCEKRGVQHNAVPFDVSKFLSDDIARYVEDGYIADHPYRFLQLKLLETIDELGGFAVLGSGEQQFYVDSKLTAPTMTDVYLAISARQVAGLEWCARNKKSHEPCFFAESPELYLAYQRIPIVQFALANPTGILQSISNSETLRRLVYKASWLAIDPRPPYDGFEFIKTSAQAKREALKEKMRQNISIFKTPITEAQRALIPST